MAFLAVAVVGLAVIALVGRNPERRNPHVNQQRPNWHTRRPR
jgi:hypothetical protein